LNWIYESFAFQGLMVYQGINIVLQEQKRKIHVAGAILDSCPGKNIYLHFFSYAKGNSIREQHIVRPFVCHFKLHHQF